MDGARVLGGSDCDVTARVGCGRLGCRAPAGQRDRAVRLPALLAFHHLRPWRPGATVFSRTSRRWGVPLSHVRSSAVGFVARRSWEAWSCGHYRGP